MPSSQTKTSFRNQLGGFAVSSFIRGLYSTLDARIVHHDKSCDPAIPEFESPCIWLFWHEYMLAPLGSWHSLDVNILVSRHRDASLLVHAARRLHMNVIEGSTNKGGTQAIRQIKRLKNTPGIAITPDGPKGPRRQMALGPIYLASLLGLPLVPTGFGFDRPMRFNTWDRFALPKFGSRCRMVMGPKIYIPRRLKRDALESHRLMVERTMNDLTATAENWAESKHRMAGEMIFQRRPNRNWLTGRIAQQEARKSPNERLPQDSRIQDAADQLAHERNERAA